MTRGELVKAARHCGGDKDCINCPVYPNRFEDSGCLDKLLLLLADALEESIPTAEAEKLKFTVRFFAGCDRCKHWSEWVCKAKSEGRSLNPEDSVPGRFCAEWEWDGT